MPNYAGYAQSVKLLEDGSAFVSVGPTPDDASLLTLVLNVADPVAVLGMKRMLLSLLTKACSHGFAVEAVTQAGSAEITSVATAGLEIAPNDQPVHEDFFAVTGNGFPQDAQLVFDSDTATVIITPDLVRPHLLLITSLSTAVPVGWNDLTVASSAGVSAPFPVDVSAEPRYIKRVFTAGTPKDYPFTLAVVANGAIDRDGSVDLYSDPILGDRAGYHDIVNYAMKNIFAVDEDFLRPDDRDAEMRIVSVFDEDLQNDVDNCLCQEDAGTATTPGSTVMFAVSERVNVFLLGYHEVADLCIAFHGSPTHTRGSANRCSDDYTRGTPLPFTYDGVGYFHHQFRAVPGTTAISVNNLTTKMTAIHELGHAASEDNNGRVRDLYQDQTYPELTINKKWRSASTDPVPEDFAEYNGSTYTSDQLRDSLGYPSTWVTYHCRLKAPAAPNLMDSYTPASRFDRLTYAWYKDRIRVNLNR